MIISIAGPAGSGKSTIAKKLSEKLGWKRYYMGGLRRDMAKKMGLTIEELNKLGETDSSTDKKVDYYQKELGEKNDDFVIEGRTSFYFIPHSFKIYLDVDLKEGAKRILNVSFEEKSKRNEDAIDDLNMKVESLKNRMESDVLRYKKYYGIENCYDKKHYDFVVDSTNKTLDEVFEIVYSEVKKRLDSKKQI